MHSLHFWGCLFSTARKSFIYCKLAILIRGLNFPVAITLNGWSSIKDKTIVILHFEHPPGLNIPYMLHFDSSFTTRLTEISAPKPIRSIIGTSQKKKCGYTLSLSPSVHTCSFVRCKTPGFSFLNYPQDKSIMFSNNSVVYLAQSTLTLHLKSRWKIDFNAVQWNRFRRRVLTASENA